MHLDDEGPGDNGDDLGRRLLHAVQAIAMSPADAAAVVKGHRARISAKHPDASEAAKRELIANVIIARYAKLAGLSGGATGLVGIVPGIGTALAMLGGGLADTAIGMKLAVDMCLCLAKNFRRDLDDQDARHLAFLLAAGTAVERAGAGAATRVASKAGVNMLREYLKGAALQAIKELFKRLGIVFTRKALEKALPFGIGVVLGGGADYALTKYIGSEAKKYFAIDAATPDA